MIKMRKSYPSKNDAYRMKREAEADAHTVKVLPLINAIAKGIAPLNTNSPSNRITTPLPSALDNLDAQIRVTLRNLSAEDTVTIFGVTVTVKIAYRKVCYKVQGAWLCLDEATSSILDVINKRESL